MMMNYDTTDHSNAALEIMLGEIEQIELTFNLCSRKQSQEMRKIHLHTNAFSNDTLI